MKLNAVFEEMESALNELNEQFNTIKNYETRVPQIEVDILMATTRTLYESMVYLNKKNQVVEAKQPESQSVADAKEPETAQMPSFEPKADVEMQSEETTDLQEEIIDYEKVTDDFLKEVDSPQEELTEEIIAEKEEIESEVKVKEEVSQAHSSLLLQFEDEIFSVNDAVATKAEDKSVVNKLSNSRIENLKSAIGINDKFYFINELFKGNSQAYDDVIYTLNNFKRFEDAMQYTSTLKYRYDWDIESEAYQKLIHFLERKFVEIHA